VSRVESSGTDNAMYRLGDAMVVQLSRLPGGAGRIAPARRAVRCSARRPRSRTPPGSGDAAGPVLRGGRGAQLPGREEAARGGGHAGRRGRARRGPGQAWTPAPA